VFHFSIDSLQNLKFYCSLLPILLTFPPNYVERYQMLYGNQFRQYLSSCFFSCSPHILSLISLTDPCNLYFQGDILFALLLVSSALPNVWRFFIIIIIIIIIINLECYYAIIKLEVCMTSEEPTCCGICAGGANYIL